MHYMLSFHETQSHFQCLLPLIRRDEGPITIRTKTLPHLLQMFIKSMRHGSRWYIYLPLWPHFSMKNTGFGYLKTRLFTIETSKNLGFGAHGTFIP